VRRRRKRQIPRLAVEALIERDLQRLTKWLEDRRIKAMLLGRSERVLTASRVNERLYGWYDKTKTRRKEARPGLLLLREAQRRGLVSTEDGVYWRDARHRDTIGTVMKGAM